MRNGYLAFERPLIELREKIFELKRFMDEKKIDLTEEIAGLEERAERLSQTLYDRLTPWQRVQIARHPNRPTASWYFTSVFDDFLELHGDRLYRDDAAMVGGIARLQGFPRPVTVIAQERGRDTREKVARNFGMPHPEGYRKALRLMMQADKFGRPIVTLVDTQGAYPGVGAEERGQSEAIARNLFAMAGFRVPIVSIITGEGGSGGALGIAMGNRLLMLEHACFSVISPEGAATILWRDAGQAEVAASSLKITSRDLHDLGIVDRVIAEPRGGAHHDPELQAENLREALLETLLELQQRTPDECMQQRQDKFAKMGVVLTEPVEETQGRIEEGGNPAVSDREEEGGV
ncbi:acetyl-CoA carboxylase carboxyltransferase subunit alpha [Pasteuria penetrans]|uniref:acetyl-CoA carboxylase carboxyltransferase subunit alpha n=1 Tax=Pasteuria penetrans TaxID=86005 RepID=UPI000F953E5B|nr:acetyl-CoA carboxylase carboxyltransferase subunit alpha [Pasteuria penetrans]